MSFSMELSSATGVAVVTLPSAWIAPIQMSSFPLPPGRSEAKYSTVSPLVFLPIAGEVLV